MTLTGVCGSGGNGAEESRGQGRLRQWGVDAAAVRVKDT